MNINPWELLASVVLSVLFFAGLWLLLVMLV